MKEVNKDAEAEDSERRVSLLTVSIWASAKTKKPGRVATELQMGLPTLGIAHVCRV